ncbi:hypothetical protein [Aquimarina pacifica]|uniref:hypothetical protein n=1 Tax=Aquimarina pacifica TaxID=1296415 RepID=UPI0013773D53|nr:hypothetical protein [Aquimarina pacifica]
MKTTEKLLQHRNSDVLATALKLITAIYIVSRTVKTCTDLYYQIENEKRKR